jgi:hypothetical protein
MIINQDSSASFTFEHGWGDGKAIDTTANQVFTHFKENVENGTPIVTAETQASKPQNGAEMLKFNLDDKMYDEISFAMNEYERVTDKFEVNVLAFGNCPAFGNKSWSYEEENKNIDVGRTWMKTRKIAPDAFQQIVMQITAAEITGN